MLIVERKNTRGKIEILASILFHCKEGLKKTHIMSKANLGYEQLCYYLPSLLDTDLIIQDIEDGCVIYRTTENGRQFLEFYFGIMKLLNQAKYGQLTIRTLARAQELDNAIANDLKSALSAVGDPEV